MNIIEEQMNFLYESTQKTFRKIPVEEEKDKMVEAEIEQIQEEKYQHLSLEDDIFEQNETI